MSAKGKQRWPQVSEKIFIDYGRDPNRQWWWKCEWHDPENTYGPFATMAETEKHSQVTVLGPQCEVKHGGQWDPAWERPQ